VVVQRREPNEIILSVNFNRSKTTLSSFCRCSVVRDLLLASITCPELSKTSSVIETPDISEAAETLLSGRYRNKEREKKKKSSHDTEVFIQPRIFARNVQSYCEICVVSRAFSTAC
jgi:hypothetical protein